MESTNRIWILMARSLSGEISIEEKEELLELLGKNVELQQQYELMIRLWKHEKPNTAIDEHANQEDREHVARILQIAKKKQAEFQAEEQLEGSYDDSIREERSQTWARRNRRIKRYAISLILIPIIFSFIFHITI